MARLVALLCPGAIAAARAAGQAELHVRLAHHARGNSQLAQSDIMDCTRVDPWISPLDLDRACVEMCCVGKSSD